MKRISTRIRILNAGHGPDGRPNLFRGIVMSGATVVASTSNVRDKAVCACLAEALQSAHRVSERTHPKG